MSEGSLVYLAGKYSSSIGPVFAAVLNAVNGNVIRDADGNAISFSQDYLVATDSDSFNEIMTGDQGDAPIIGKTQLDAVIGDDVTYDAFAEIVK